MDKIKVLAWGDYCCTTGFGSVMSSIWSRLMATGKYELDVIGINYNGDPYDPGMWPGNVYTAMSAMNIHGAYADPYGRQKLLDRLGAGEYDILFLLQDTFILQSVIKEIVETQSKVNKPFKTVFYFPIDASPKPDWIKEAVTPVNFPVVYTNYGYKECVQVDPRLNNKLKVIYHGNDFEHFFHIDNREEVANFRSTAFRGVADNKFLMLNVNRNQRRKDIARSFMILDELLQRGVDAVLYCHMAPVDVGGDLTGIAQNFGLELNKHYMVPENFDVNRGFPVPLLNMVYNAADCYLTTTHSEGWGLGVSEAMATKTPIIAPNNSSLTEMLADNRGYLVSSGATPSMWIVKENDNDRLRPLMDVEEAADRVEDLISGKRPDVDGAQKWITQHSWDNIASEWDNLLDEVYKTPIFRRPQKPVNRKKKKKR